MLLPLDGPSLQDALSVTTGTVVEAKVGGSPLAERKAVVIQPLNGNLYLYFDDGTNTAPSVANMAAKGLLLYAGAKDAYEASESQKLWILATTATTNTIIVERA